MRQAHITSRDRSVIAPALERAQETGAPAAAIELPDGSIITGKTSELLGACSAMLLNALKELAGIPHELHVISPESLTPICLLKTRYLGSKNPRLHMDEVLIALSATAASDDTARKVLEQLPRLAQCQAHSSVILSETDMKTFNRLGIQFTTEPKYENEQSFI